MSKTVNKEAKVTGGAVSSSYHKLQRGLDQIISSKSKAETKKEDEKKESAVVATVNPVTVKSSTVASSEKRDAIPLTDIPDRSKSDYYCKFCDSHMNSLNMWQSHVAGKRHLKSIRKENNASCVKYVPAGRIHSTIQQQLDEVEEPVVGLSFMCELHRSPVADPIYVCYLCQGNSSVSTVVDHILSSKHRLNYLKYVDPRGCLLLDSMGMTRSGMDSLIYDKAYEWEEKEGRGTMEIKKEKPKNDPPAPKRQRHTSEESNDSEEHVQDRRASPADSLNIEFWTPNFPQGPPPLPFYARAPGGPISSCSPDPVSHSGVQSLSRSHTLSPTHVHAGEYSNIPRSERCLTPQPSSYSGSADVDVKLLSTHTRIQLIKDLISPEINNDEEAHEVSIAVREMLLSLMQYKIKNMSQEHQLRLAQEILSSNTETTQDSMFRVLQNKGPEFHNDSVCDTGSYLNVESNPGINFQRKRKCDSSNHSSNLTVGPEILSHQNLASVYEKKITDFCKVMATNSPSLEQQKFLAKLNHKDNLFLSSGLNHLASVSPYGHNLSSSSGKLRSSYSDHPGSSSSIHIPQPVHDYDVAAASEIPGLDLLTPMQGAASWYPVNVSKSLEAKTVLSAASNSKKHETRTSSSQVSRQSHSPALQSTQRETSRSNMSKNGWPAGQSFDDHSSFGY